MKKCETCTYYDTDRTDQPCCNCNGENYEESEKGELAMTDNDIKKALDRLKTTKDYLREQYQEQVKKCPYPELKPLVKQTYEDKKKAFDIAIKAIEKINRLQAENDRLKKEIENLESTQEISPEAKYLVDTKADKVISLLNEVIKGQEQIKAEAYKEFAEKAIELIKTKAFNLSLMRSLYTDQSSKALYRCAEDIDNLLKEMVGEGQ